MSGSSAYVIAGASLAGAKAAETLRGEGFDGPVVLIGDETERPYERPPLSKDYLLGKAERETIYVHPASWYADSGVQLRLGVPVAGIDGVLYLRRVGAEVARVFAGLHREHGVDLRCGVQVSEITSAGGRVTGVRLADGSQVDAEAVIVGVGITPNTQLAETAGLETGNGVVVDAALRSSDPDIFAAGDVADALHPVLGRHIRVEHWANALNQPQAAARAMPPGGPGPAGRRRGAPGGRGRLRLGCRSAPARELAHQAPEPQDLGVPRVEHRLDDVHRGMHGGLQVTGNAVAEETASQRPAEPFRGDRQQIGRLFSRLGGGGTGPGLARIRAPAARGLPRFLAAGRRDYAGAVRHREQRRHRTRLRLRRSAPGGAPPFW